MTDPAWLDELERLEKAATRGVFEFDQDTANVLVGERADRYEKRPVGYVQGMMTMGNGEEGYMTPELAALVAALCNHAPALIAAARREAKMRAAMEDILSVCTGYIDASDNTRVHGVIDRARAALETTP